MSVVVAFTGGTISMLHDPGAGGNVPSLDGAAILARTPGLAEIAEVLPLELGRTPASHFTFDRLFEILSAVRASVAAPGVTGAVIVQGTDTIEETSFFFDLLWDDPRPLVVTGAMRSASHDDYDGPANLRDAVRVAASPRAHDQGCLVVLAGTIHGGDDVAKTSSTAIDTFQSPNLGRVGRLDGHGVAIERVRGPRRHVAARHAAAPIPIVVATLHDDPLLVDAAIERQVMGLVVEATGSGNTSPALLAAAQRAIAAGIPVVHASRCASGATNADYAFPGGGATWRAAGALGCGTLSGVKARVALALGLGAGLDGTALAALLAGPPQDPPDRAGTPA